MNLRTRVRPRIGASAAALSSTLVLCLSPIRAQEQDPEGPATPSLAELEALAEKLDQAFEARTTSEFLSHFDTIHLGHQATVRDRLDSVFTFGIECARDSEILENWTVGGHAVAHIRSVVRPTGFQDTEMVEHYLLAARYPAGVNDRPAQITLLLQIADELLPAIRRPTAQTNFTSRFECPVCNYDVECGDNWLAAPVCQERYGGVETISFHSLQEDVKVFVSVHLDEEPIDPKEYLAGLNRFAQAPTITSWEPRSFDEADAPPELSAARALFALDGTNRRNEAYCVAYGHVSYVFEVEGSVDAIDKRMGEVEGLVSSFRLSNTDLGPDEVAAAIMAYRRAGKVTASNLYVNDGLEVSLQGPEDWAAELTTGGLVFDLKFRRPESRQFVSARGIAPPRGRGSWSPAMADSATSQILAAEGLEVLAQTDWIERGNAQIRDCRLKNTDGRFIVLRLALRDDLLIVLEGRCDEAGAIDGMMSIFDSLDC